MRLDVVSVSTDCFMMWWKTRSRTTATIREYFGDEVAHLVGGLTRLRTSVVSRARNNRPKNVRKMLLAMVDDVPWCW